MRDRFLRGADLQRAGVPSRARAFRAREGLMVMIGVDWNSVFLQLQREGYSTPDIEHFTGIRRSTFMGWKNGGAQPNHPSGERMIGFWCDVTGKGRQELPMKPIEMSAAKVGR